MRAGEAGVEAEAGPPPYSLRGGLLAGLKAVRLAVGHGCGRQGDARSLGRAVYRIARLARRRASGRHLGKIPAIGIVCPSWKTGGLAAGTGWEEAASGHEKLDSRILRQIIHLPFNWLSHLRRRDGDDDSGMRVECSLTCLSSPVLSGRGRGFGRAG